MTRRQSIQQMPNNEDKYTVSAVTSAKETKHLQQRTTQDKIEEKD